jgi:hypothetical protein
MKLALSPTPLTKSSAIGLGDCPLILKAACELVDDCMLIDHYTPMYSNQVLQPVAGDSEWAPLEQPDNPLGESLINGWDVFSDLAAQADHEQDVQLGLDLLEADLGFAQLEGGADDGASANKKSRLAESEHEKRDEVPCMHEGFLAVLNRKSPMQTDIPSLEELQIPLIPFSSLDNQESTPITEVRKISPPKQHPTPDFEFERALTPDATLTTATAPGTQPRLRRGKKRGRPCSGVTKIVSKKIERLPGENETTFKRRRNRAQAAISRARKDEQIDIFLEKADTITAQIQNAKKTLAHTEQVNRLFMSELCKHYGEKSHALVRKALLQANLQMGDVADSVAPKLYG